MKRQFVKNLGTNWVVYFTAAFISFLLTPYIIHKLGQAAFGVWILVGSFSGYLGLFDFGIGFAVVRFVARYQKTGDIRSRNEIIATTFYVAMILALLVMAVTIFIMLKAADYFDIPPELTASAQGVILLIGLSIAIGFPLSVFSEALAGGLYRFDLFNIVSFLMAIFRTILTVILIESGLGLIGLGVAALSASIIGYLWRLQLLRKLLPDLSIKLRLVNRGVARKIGNYSFFSFILVLSGRVAFYSDSFIVGFFKGIEAVAIFGIASKLVEYLRQLTFTLTRLFSPVASRLDPDTDKQELKRIFFDGSRLNLLFSLPLSLILYFWGGALIKIWVGSDFNYSVVILQVLLIGHLASFTQAISGEILLGVGRHQTFALFSIVGAIVNVILSIILVREIGLVGVAWGTTLPLIFISMIYLPIAAIKLVKTTLGDYLREAILPAVLSSLIPGLYVFVVTNKINNYIDLVYLLVIFGLIYAPLAWFVGLKKAERDKIISAIKYR